MNEFIRDLKELSQMLKEKNDKVLDMRYECEINDNDLDYINSVIDRLKNELEKTLKEKGNIRGLKNIKKRLKKIKIFTLILGNILGLLLSLLSMPYSFILILIDLLIMYFITNNINKKTVKYSTNLKKDELSKKVKYLSEEIEELSGKKNSLDYKQEVMKHDIAKTQNDINDLIYNIEVYENNYREAIRLCQEKILKEKKKGIKLDFQEEINAYYHNNYMAMFYRLKKKQDKSHIKKKIM